MRHNSICRGSGIGRAFVPLSKGQSNMVISGCESEIVSCRQERHKCCNSGSLRSEQVRGLSSPTEHRSGSIPSMTKWHKRPQKAATLCHFFAAVFLVWAYNMV
jgi:hypothetical protein